VLATVIKTEGKKHDVDRSFTHFSLLARNVGKAMDINSFFIATDNRSAIEEAAIRYSEMNWFTQARILPKYKRGIDI
jgi:hypothetical protein